MARNGIVPLSTTIALAFTSGSCTTSQRPTPKKLTTARTKPAPPTAEGMLQLRGRGAEAATGLSGVAIGAPPHPIPLRRSGQFAWFHHKVTMRVAHYLRPPPSI